MNIDTEDRVNKRAFLALVTARCGLPAADVAKVYDTCVEILIEVVTRGETVMLTGFGRFYRQLHRGHTVQFKGGSIADYMVLKFTATRGVNRAIEKAATGVEAEAGAEPA